VIKFLAGRLAQIKELLALILLGLLIFSLSLLLWFYGC
jgi:hypothetical protein